MNEIVKGHIDINTVVGNSVFIEHKGKKILLKPDSELEMKELSANRPQIDDGDIISTGSRCLISINSTGYNDKSEKYMNSSMLMILPNSKVRIRTKNYEEKIGRNNIRSNVIVKIELMQGLFGVNTTEELETPNTLFEHGKTPNHLLNGNETGYMLIDVLSSSETHIHHMTFDDKAGLFVVCKQSGAKFEAAKKITGAGKNFQKEVIVSGGAIYCIPLTKFEGRSATLRSYTFTLLNPNVHSFLGKVKDSDRQLLMQEQSVKNAPDTEAQMGYATDAASMFLKFKKMSPAQMKELGIPTDQIAQMKEMLKDVDEEKFSEMNKQMQGVMGEFKKQSAKMKSSGIDFSKMAHEGAIASKRLNNSAMADMKKMFDEIERLPPYPPLKSEYKKA